MLVGVTERAVVVLLRFKRDLRVRVLGSPLCTRLTRMILRGIAGLLWSSFPVL
jgi:hypothetical protein